MNDFNIKAALEWLSAIVVAIGGTGVIIIGLAKWFGNFIANKLLEKDKAKYSEELETLKNKYQQELEARKASLEKSKALFLRYSEHQFSLYNDVWKNLCDLKHIGEELWEKAEPPKLKEFSKQLRTTNYLLKKVFC